MLTKICGKLQFFIFALSCVSSVTGLITLNTLHYCCGLGNNFAESGLKCASFQTPIAGVSPEDERTCLNSVNVCCKNKYQEKQCNAGKALSMSKSACVSSGDEDDSYKGCCEACQLGMTTGSSGQSCGVVLGFGPPYDATFTSCCEEAQNPPAPTSATKLSTSSTSTLPTSVTTTTNNLTPIESNSVTTPKEQKEDYVLVEVCDLCAQLCYPFNNANRCDCQKGFTLMKDGMSCKPNKRPATRCVKNNPCEHDCIDTGLSIQCSCRIGYKLANDKTSCTDVDECELGTHKCAPNEVCINYEGDYDCEDPNEFDEPQCPEGYRFDADNKLCNDVNECEFSLVCERPKECVNTMGSYKCVGEDPPSCPPGYYYKESIMTCADIDECVTGQNDCNRESQTCLNTKGNYTCMEKASKTTCPPGFKKNSLDECEDINECEETPNLCGESEVCINEPGGHTCLPKHPLPPKPTHFSTPTESTTLTPWTSTPTVSTHPVFTRPDSTQLVFTSPAFTPTTSTTSTSTASNLTSALPPLVFLTTERTLPLYTPEPTQPVPTPNVERPTPVNSNRRPEHPGRLTPPPYRPSIHDEPQYNPYPEDNMRVSCSHGYKYSPQHNDCIDIDECAEDSPCDSNQDCYNKPASYVCNCKLGFTRDFQTGACVDINECQIGTHDCLEGQRCDNTIGSFLCSRTAGCGTGYTLNYASGLCEDDDECVLGTNNCGDLGPKFQCRNTLGSYRCDLKPTTPFRFNPRTTTFRYNIISGQVRHCLPGSVMTSNGQCEDIDECKSSPCGRGQKCLNLNGRYQCISAIQCHNGFELNGEGDGCVDINECTRGTHQCGATKICKNAPGYYICQCPPGHQLDANRECVDIDECQHYRGRVCPSNADCINSIGSYSCRCKEGFRGNNTYCEDINECAEQANLCQQKCVNLYGGYRCSCERGFTLNSDNRTCSDIDECEKFKDRGLCIGNCTNIPGSYACSCPDGYRIGSDGRTCQDIDECMQDPCRGPDEICFNMRGSYRCPSIKCPANYMRDRDHRSRCTRGLTACDSRDSHCLELPRFYTFHFVTLVSNYMVHKPIDFFHMKGPTTPDTSLEYQLVLKNVQCPSHVRKVDESYFTTTRQKRNILVGIVKSIEGPQEVELNLHTNFYVNGVFHAKALARIFVLVSAYAF